MNKPAMSSRERLLLTINHKEPDRLVVDIGAGGQTGMGVCAVHHLRNRIFGNTGYRVKVTEPYQMLGEIDEELRQKLNLDVVGIHPPENMFGFRNEKWKPFTMHDGVTVDVPGKFNFTRDDDGAVFMHAEGDLNIPPRAKMAAGSYFFDSIPTGKSADYNNLNPDDNTEEFTVLSNDDVSHFSNLAKKYFNETGYGIYMTLPGMAFGLPHAIMLKCTTKRDPGWLRIWVAPTASFTRASGSTKSLSGQETYSR